MLMCETTYHPQKKIWSGPRQKIFFNDFSSAGEAVLFMLQKNPDKVIQISENDGVKVTSKQMHIMSIRACQNFHLKGLKQNDVIGIAASNSHNLAPIVFGSFLCGTAISTLDPSFKKDEIKHMYSNTKPKIIFCDPENYQDMRDSVAELKLNSTIYLMKGELEGVKTVDEFLKPTGKENYFVVPKLIDGVDQVATILCSSGTTGLPKGVCISHKMLLRNTGLGSVTENDVILCYSTLYWLTGLFMLLYGVLNGCLRIIIDEPFSVDSFFNMVEKYHITYYLCPPSQMALITQSPEIMKRDLSSILNFVCGGSAVPTIIKERMEKHLSNGFVFVGYGMSEIAGLGTIESTKFRRMGSTGQVGVNTEFKILDDHGNSLGVGEKGELCMKPIGKWPGYFNNVKATKEIYDDEEWIHSGDIGYFDNDGYLFIIDRKKEILKYKNFHFFPNEIEQIILELPDVLEVSVCGLPDVVYTDLPTALVIKEKGSSINEEIIAEHVEKKLADFKRLRGGVYFVDSLPKTPSGKIQKRKIKSMAIELSEKK